MYYQILIVNKLIITITIVMTFELNFYVLPTEVY
jgi:hypothetical protein